ncbi:MAG: glycogen/starch synthase [Rikenellaceae bacterium]
MKKGAKILYVCQELMPYLPENKISVLCRQLPQQIQEKGGEIRTFMPRFGSVNERRNQLHEVIRLSGMNIIIDDSDHQLIIKVASIPSARMQVYFIDNDDYFNRKFEVKDADGTYFADNDERSLFFARGIIETASKLRWSPDIVHCHGWFSAIMPVYIKRLYSDNPLFAHSKIIISLYADSFTGSMNENFASKLQSEGVKHEELNILQDPTHENLLKFAIQYADGVVITDKDVNPSIIEFAKGSGTKVLEITDEENYAESYASFYDSILLPE